MIARKFTESSFETYPVWTWSADERSHCPVANTDPLPRDIGTVFVKARLYTASGMELKGYVIVDFGSVFAIGMLLGCKNLVFNRNLPEMAEHELNDLFSTLNTKPFQVFPLEYVTDFSFEGEENLRGDFDFK